MTWLDVGCVIRDILRGEIGLANLLARITYMPAEVQKGRHQQWEPRFLSPEPRDYGHRDYHIRSSRIHHAARNEVPWFAIMRDFWRTVSEDRDFFTTYQFWTVRSRQSGRKLSNTNAAMMEGFESYLRSLKLKFVTHLFSKLWRRNGGDGNSRMKWGRWGIGNARSLKQRYIPHFATSSNEISQKSSQLRYTWI